MATSNQNLYSVILGVRECFNRLKALGEKLHRDLGINASKRAVLEALWQRDERTVPEIARARGVSRQHVQLIANSLLEAGLVTSSENPNDKRTSYLALTDRGRSVFAEVQKREATVLARLAPAFNEHDLKRSEETLATLCQQLERLDDEPN